MHEGEARRHERKGVRERVWGQVHEGEGEGIEALEGGRKDEGEDMET